MTLGQEAIMVTIVISAPLLLTALTVGLVISIIQAATQINETTLSFIPKLLAIFAALVIAGPWMLSYMADYMTRMLHGISNVLA
jgi:flagellar biosynthesis protein FliQ